MMETLVDILCVLGLGAGALFLASIRVTKEDDGWWGDE
jgi:hypothetical protein